MTRITIDIRKSVEQNAETYFERAKKAKKKLEGARKAIEIQKKKLFELQKEAPKEEKSEEKDERKKHWYEKFRWFFSSEGFLCIGGRDATTNEIIVKKHAEKNDIVMHTDMAGSPFVIVKIPNTDNIPTEKTLKEAADFVAAHSKAWKLGMGSVAVFWVNPEQVSKEAQPGEFLPKGAFMIRGKTNYITPTMNYAIGLYGDAVMGAPISAIKHHCKEYVEIVQGNEKISEVGKIVQKKIGGDLDEIIRALPPGCKVKKGN